MKITKWIAAVIIGIQLASAVVRADDTADAIAALKKQIEALNAKVEDLQSQVQNQQLQSQQWQSQHPVQAQASSTNEVSPVRTAPFITAGADGFWMKSADTNFTLHIGAVSQLDWHYYGSPNPGAKDTLTIRRLRLITSGTLYHDYDYYIQTDFGAGNSVTATNNSMLQDAYLNIHYWPQFQLQAGKMKEPIGLEILPADASLWFVERSYPSELVPFRNTGAELHGDLFGGALNYAAGIFNGVPDGGSGDIETGANSKDAAARIFALPFTNTSMAALRNFGIGLGSSFGYEASSATPSFTTMGRQKFFAYQSGSGTAASPLVTEEGNHLRLVPQGYYLWGPAGLYWEYADSSEKFKLTNPTIQHAWFDTKAWDVSASWYLTGEKNAFWNPPPPLHPFRVDGSGFGAWQLTARLGGIDLDKSAFTQKYAASGSAQSALTWGVGLNWYMNRNIKWMFDYEQTRFGFAPGAANGPVAASVEAQDEKVLMGRLQFAF